MSDARSPAAIDQHPPKPRFVLRIGVTGHRGEHLKEYSARDDILTVHVPPTAPDDVHLDIRRGIQSRWPLSRMRPLSG